MRTGTTIFSGLGLAQKSLRQVALVHKIEHRPFSFISQNWRGKPLVSHQAIVNLITATQTGLRYTVDDKRMVGKFQLLGLQQQVIMRLVLDEATVDYMVRLEGAVDFSDTPPPT